MSAGYSTGTADPTCFDPRYCRFWGFEYEDVVARTLAGDSDDEVFAALFQDRTINPEHILFWNTFIEKRGLHDEASVGLEADKAANGMGGRIDVRTYLDYIDVDEGRELRRACGAS